MKRNKLIFTFSIIFCFISNLEVFSQGLEIVIIPVNYLEKRGNNFVQSSTTKNIAKDISDHLKLFYNIKFDTTRLNDTLAGATDMDARRVADYHRVDNVIYGQIRDDGNSLVAEFNAYNRHRDNYGRFFASDSVNRYDRLIKNISDQILEWYNTDTDKIEALRNEIRDMQSEIEQLRKEAEEKEETKKIKEPRENEIEKELIFKVPVNVGYWAYTDTSWADQVQGTVEFSTGIHIFPELQMPFIYGIKNEFSLDLNIGYRNGITRYYDEVLLNALIINPSFSYHINIYSKNWLHIGAGIFIDMGFWQLTRPETGIKESYTETLSGFSLFLEYSYQLSNRFTINFGSNLYGYFSKGSSFIIRPYLGTTITIFRRKNEV